MGDTIKGLGICLLCVLLGGLTVAVYTVSVRVDTTRQCEAYQVQLQQLRVQYAELEAHYRHLERRYIRMAYGSDTYVYRPPDREIP